MLTSLFNNDNLKSCITRFMAKAFVSGLGGVNKVKGCDDVQGRFSF